MRGTDAGRAMVPFFFLFFSVGPFLLEFAPYFSENSLASVRHVG